MDANSKLIQDLYAAFSRGDIPFILDGVADSVEFQNSDAKAIPYGGSFKGRDGITQYFEKIGGALEVKSFDRRTYLSSGDEVMTTGVWSGVARSTGKTFTSEWAMRFVVKNGKVTFARVYEDTAAMAAAMRS